MSVRIMVTVEVRDEKGPWVGRTLTIGRDTGPSAMLDWTEEFPRLLQRTWDHWASRHRDHVHELADIDGASLSSDMDDEDIPPGGITDPLTGE